jgi:hypothetical protein
MRLLSGFTLLAVYFACSPGSVGSKSVEQPDISRSDSEFLEVCSSACEHKGDPVPIHDGATCLGWVEGFRDGFTVHDELLGVPEKGQDDLFATRSNHRSNRSRN